jgi:sulfur-oxidizing protein SoxY
MTLAAPTRRRCLIIGASGLILPLAPVVSARATPAAVAALIADLVGDATLHDGRVKLDLPVLVENGNAVAMTVSVDAPLGGPAAVCSIDVFAERNPLPHVARFSFGPRAGAPRVATRIRLATSQTVIAVAKLADGSCWRDSVDLIVTLAACIDGI